MRNGAALVHMHVTVSKKQWFIVPGSPATDRTAARIRERPDVIAQRDGLFPGHDQTWRLQAEAC
jgi:hypothetical protein